MQVSFVMLVEESSFLAKEIGVERGTKHQDGPWIPYLANSLDSKDRLTKMASLPKEALLPSEERLSMALAF